MLPYDVLFVTIGIVLRGEG